MKLSYFELLSPEPVEIKNAGGILSPKLRSIAALGYNTYQYYLSILLLDAETLLSMFGGSDQYKRMPKEAQEQIHIFDLLTASEQSYSLLQNILNFFIKEEIIYSPENKGFVSRNGSRESGIITKDLYPQVCDLICQRNCVKFDRKEDLSRVKSKKALEIMKKLQKGRAERLRQTKTDQNMELGNIISAVASKSHSLNILNIWDLTVFQLWDCFARLTNNSIYDIQSMSVAAWGNKNNYFDVTAWFKRIETDK